MSTNDTVLNDIFANKSEFMIENDTTDFMFENDTTEFGLENKTEFEFQNATGGDTFPKGMLGFTAACAFIIAVLGTFGNLLTILALPACRKLRTTATAFVINLAVVELLFCLVILPMSGAQYAYLQYTSTSLLSDRDCVYFAITRYTLTQAELQTIVAIALTRAVAVGFPSFYTKINTWRVTGGYIALIWVYSFAMKLPTGLGFMGSYISNHKTMECDVARDAKSAKARFISLMIEAVVPVLFIILLYIFIFVMVKKSSYRVSRSTAKGRKPSASVSSSAAPEDEPGARKGSAASFKNFKRMMSDSNFKDKLSRRPSATNCIGTSRRDMKVARTIFIIFMMVLVCSVPVAYVHMTDSIVRRPTRFLAVHILYWVQYCLNFVVYVLMNRQYRIAYVEFVSKLLPSWEQHRNFTFPWENHSVSSRQAGPHSSVKNRKDSCSQDPAATPQEYKSVENNLPQRPGRLSAIQEVTSTSAPSNDDVFVPEEIENLGASDASLESDSTYKFHGEKGSAEEKEHWVNRNGDIVHSPAKEDKV